MPPPTEMPLPFTLRRRKFIAGEADEAGDKPDSPVVESSSGEPICSTLPAFITTILSAMVHGLDLVARDVNRGGLAAAGHALISVRIDTRSFGVEIGERLVETGTPGLRTMARPLATR